MSTETLEQEKSIEPAQPREEASVDDQPAAKAPEAQPKPKAAKASPKQSKAGKSKRDDKQAKDSSAAGPSIASHPRASAQIPRAKAWGGLAGFGIATYLSLQASVPLDQTLLRALVAGVGGYMLAWACAVTVWRHLVLTELRTLAGLSPSGHVPRPAVEEGAAAAAGEGSHPR